MRRMFAVFLPFLVIFVVALPARPAFALAASYPPGWNLVSGPEGARLVGSAGPLYTFQPGDSSYEVLATGAPLHACVGYWAYFPGGGGLDAAPGRASPCSLNVASGEWSMAGNPSVSGRAALSGATAAYVYRADSGMYEAATGVDVGQGVWITGPSTVAIVPPVVQPSSPTGAAPVRGVPGGAPVAEPIPVPCADGTAAPDANSCAGHGGPAQPQTGDCTVVRDGVVIHIHC